MGRLKFALLAVLAIMITASPKMAFAPVADPDVEVPRLRILVNLDGAITGGEWSDAVTIPTTFHFDDPGSTTRAGTIFLKHDCVSLWICMQIADPNENEGSWMAVMYDVSGNSALGSGDDEKAMIHPDIALDAAIIPTPPNWDNDTNLGGRLDIQGASGWSGGTLTYEFVHPLNSGDTAGNDPALKPGDSILAMYYAGDPEIGLDYIGSGGQYDLIITPCAAVGGTIIQTDHMAQLIPVLASHALTLALVSTAIITYKRRENKKNAN